jgi:hypothetical protein
MGERFIPGAAQASEHVNKNTITTHGYTRASVDYAAGTVDDRLKNLMREVQELRRERQSIQPKTDN